MKVSDHWPRWVCFYNFKRWRERNIGGSLFKVTNEVLELTTRPHRKQVGDSDLTGVARFKILAGYVAAPLRMRSLRS